MKQLVFLLLFLSSYTIFAQQDSPINLYQQSEQLYRAKDYSGYIKASEKLLAYIYSPNILLKTTIAHQINKQPKQAIDCLQQLSNIQACAVIDTIPAFQNLKNERQFQRLAKKLKKGYEPINHAEKVIQLEDESLIPEGMAYDANSNKFYLVLCQLKIEGQSEISFGLTFR